MTTEVVITEQTVNKIIVNEPNQSIILTCGVSAGGAGGGALFISDVTPASGGIVSTKLWEAGTVPVQSDITECTTDEDAVNVHVYVEGDSSIYTPEVTINGITVTNLTQDTYDKRTYSGFVQLSITDTTTVVAMTASGLQDTVIINRAAVGPAISDITFGAYPGIQTELKAGDVIPVTVTTAPEAVSVTFYAFGAANAVVLSASGGTATGNLTINSASGTLTVKAYATNGFGTAGADFTSTATLLLNQTYPTIATPSIVYPIGQTALKAVETASLTASVTNFDTITYSTPANIMLNELSNVYDLTKTVNRFSGDYIVSGSNYTITANRIANNATSTRSALVKIVNVAPTASISIDGSPARLRSTLAGKYYTLRVTANQQLKSYNSLDSDKGTLSAFSSNTKTILIVDSTIRGIGNFGNMSITGLSGIVGNDITSGSTFTVGGFEPRIITFGVVSNREPIGTTIGSFTKTRFRLAGTVEWFTREVSTADVIDGFTITDSAGNYNPSGDYIFLTSTALVGSNSAGTLQGEFEEEV